MVWGNKVHISDHENVQILENSENKEKYKKKKYYS